MSNILVLSVGTRNKIIQYFKKELQGKGKVITTDMSRLAPALYEADAFYIVPRMTEPGYIEKILEICRTEKIQGVLSLIDPELSLLAENKDRFAAIGTCVIGSDYEICERSLNKWEMYQWLEAHHYHCAKSYVDKEEFFNDIEKGQAKYPVFVKQIYQLDRTAEATAYNPFYQVAELDLTHDTHLSHILLLYSQPVFFPGY